ncbi:hypothetical protein CEP54_012959 [Fusarium duplospermum]|uniref:2EXR domain-containing protein n=1 Tax=Fusarium duplospermum TaxID=1325734 RepID=A0A428P5Q4_9HYPO|nr:hypothetical protein CEP54_012959 [Fusarium duplospermum]
MTSSIFHPFPRLPTELRLQIWEKACLPSRRQHFGLHYFTIGNDKKLVPVGWNKARRPKKHRPENQGNRSAYLWHAGLWAACRESRAVIIEHYQFNDWEELMGTAENEGESPRRVDTNSEMAVPPAMITVREGHDRWYFTVYPTRDIICVTPDGCELIFWSGERFSMLNSLPFATSDTLTLGVANLALEFDPSWNCGLPGNIFTLKEERSPRGFLARMLEDIVDGSCCPSLWIIDKNVRWSIASDRVICPVFYGYDGEYVEIQLSDTHPDPERRARGSPVAYFLRRLGKMGDEDLRERWGRSPLFPTRADALTERCIRLLARRDNQVAGDVDGSIRSLRPEMGIGSS